MSSETGAKSPSYRGRYLSVNEEAGWEYVVRNSGPLVVAVVALLPDERILLVEQRRPPIGRSILELPAGLVGDIGEEEPLEAAKRELLEETGYTASQWAELSRCPCSPGLTNETAAFYRAEQLSRTASGGGVDGEHIRIVEMSIKELAENVITPGATVDLKVAAALSMLS